MDASLLPADELTAGFPANVRGTTEERIDVQGRSLCRRLSGPQKIRDLELRQRAARVAEKIAGFASALQAVPDGAGSLLDGTMLLCVNDLGKGNAHTITEVPYVIVGTAHGAIPGGRFHTFAGRYQTDLLLAVCHAMGVDLDTFGNPDVNAGPLPL